MIVVNLYLFCDYVSQLIDGGILLENAANDCS